MKGYWKKPEATREAFFQDGWLRSGDAGYFDDEGFLYIHDRVKDMIITGGENVYPAEVENALFGHPALADAAVIGIPDPRWGETVKAIIVLVPGKQATAEDIIAYARERIAGYKLPKSVDFVASLPRNPTGKVPRRELRRGNWQGKQQTGRLSPLAHAVVSRGTRMGATKAWRSVTRGTRVANRCGIRDARDHASDFGN